MAQFCAQLRGQVISVRALRKVGGEVVFSGEDVLAGADVDGAVAACGTDESLDVPAGAVLDHGSGKVVTGGSRKLDTPVFTLGW